VSIDPGVCPGGVVSLGRSLIRIPRSRQPCPMLSIAVTALAWAKWGGHETSEAITYIEDCSG